MQPGPHIRVHPGIKVRFAIRQNLEHKRNGQHAHPDNEPTNKHGGERYPELLGVKGTQAVLQVSCKRMRLNRVMRLRLRCWSTGEASGIPSVAVKCVDIGKNIGGEGDLLDGN